MKKSFLILCIALATVGTANAKKEKDVGIKGLWTAGLNLSYGTKVSSPGIGAEATYGVTNHIRLDAGLDYFFKTSDLQMVDFNVNANWMFKIKHGLKIYPLVGISYAHWQGDMTKIKGLADEIDETNNQFDMTPEEYEEWLESQRHGTKDKFGFNFGGGLQYDINDKWGAKAEVKFHLLGGGCSQCVVGVGAFYKF